MSRFDSNSAAKVREKSCVPVHALILDPSWIPRLYVVTKSFSCAFAVGFVRLCL